MASTKKSPPLAWGWQGEAVHRNSEDGSYWCNCWIVSGVDYGDLS